MHTEFLFFLNYLLSRLCINWNRLITALWRIFHEDIPARNSPWKAEFRKYQDYFLNIIAGNILFL